MVNLTDVTRAQALRFIRVDSSQSNGVLYRREDGFGPRPNTTGENNEPVNCGAGQLRETVFAYPLGSNTAGTQCAQHMGHVSAHIMHHSTGCNGGRGAEGFANNNVVADNFFAATAAANHILEGCENSVVGNTLERDIGQLNVGSNVGAWHCGYTDTRAFNVGWAHLNSAWSFIGHAPNEEILNEAATLAARAACTHVSVWFGSGVIDYYAGIMVKHVEGLQLTVGEAGLSNNPDVAALAANDLVPHAQVVALRNDGFSGGGMGGIDITGGTVVMKCILPQYDLTTGDLMQDPATGNYTDLLGLGPIPVPVPGGVAPTCRVTIGLDGAAVRARILEEVADKMPDDGSILESLDNVSTCGNPTTFEYDGYI